MPSDTVTTPNLQDISMLKSIIVALSTKLDADEIIRSGCDVLQQFFKAPHVFVWEREDSGEEFYLNGAHPAGPERFPESEPLHNRSYLSIFTGKRGDLSAEHYPWLAGEDIAADLYPYPNLKADFRLNNYTSLFQVRGIAAALLIPIKSGAGVTAVIELVFDRAQKFDETELLFAQSVATAIGSSIETGRHYQSLQNYTEFLDNALAQRTSELKSERDRTRAILDALGEAVVVTDLNWKIQYSNPAAEVLTGFSQEELLGQQLRLWRSQRQTAEFNTQVFTTTESGG
ncbi:MAG: PAS domain-containing protein, partial [Anaerolineales bacterium]|nr:PAS domain-containing protein [Anaerolineales bacterium]